MSIEKQNVWNALRRFTPARVAIGRAGGSVPTSALLDFRLAHARARDALLRPLDEARLLARLGKIKSPVLQLRSAATTFEEYLLRPDLGRTLAPEAVEQLLAHRNSPPGLAIIVSEGLSTLAVETHAAAVLEHLVPQLANWRLAPLCFVRRARVAIQDHVGELLGAQLALILLGERPGLASPDSLGAYLVHAPRVGNTDAQRNCVSNISAHGLSAKQAAAKIHWLLTEARARAISGVALKDEFDPTRQITGSRS